jgi:MFS family permease
MPLNQRSDEVEVQDAVAAGHDHQKIVPNWSIALAILLFVAVQYLFHGVMPHDKYSLLPMRLLMGYSWGTIFGSYVLLIGYVSLDVKRRGMAAGLWMLIVLVMPVGIGAVIYFLLRQPLVAACSHCGSEIAASYHFCPQCQFQTAPVCERCFNGVKITDAYCRNCGHTLGEGQAPARLHVFGEGT